jgi:hypothetical protein
VANFHRATRIHHTRVDEPPRLASPKRQPRILQSARTPAAASVSTRDLRSRSNAGPPVALAAYLSRACGAIERLSRGPERALDSHLRSHDCSRRLDRLEIRNRQSSSDGSRMGSTVATDRRRLGTNFHSLQRHLDRYESISAVQIGRPLERPPAPVGNVAHDFASLGVRIGGSRLPTTGGFCRAAASRAVFRTVMPFRFFRSAIAARLVVLQRRGKYRPSGCCVSLISALTPIFAPDRHGSGYIENYPFLSCRNPVVRQG